VLTSPPVPRPGGAHGHALLWSWTADGIEALGRFAEACHTLDMALLVGIARWVPLDTVLGVLASAGLTPRAASHHRSRAEPWGRTPTDPGRGAGHRGRLALLELVTWSAPWHRGRQQPLRMAVEGVTPHDLRDHPHASDLRDVWLQSPAALRLASPEIVLVGEADDHARPRCPCGPLSRGDAGGRRPGARPTIRWDDRPSRPRRSCWPPTGSEPRCPRVGRSGRSDAAVLQQLAAGTQVELPDTVRRQLAPEVVDAAEDPDLGAASAVRQLRARTRLRWSVLRHHSAVGLAASLEARTGRELAPRPRLTLCLHGTIRMRRRGSMPPSASSRPSDVDPTS
jgi:hypothetical protein